MAFSAGTNWEVRTTGSDANGGGFNVTSTGTDYSQQDAPFYAYTDLAIGATTTQLSSAARPFIAADVGNVLNIVSGTGFTVQRVQIVSVASGVATCDKSCGTASSTGGAGNLGGGCLTIATALGLTVAGNAVWIKTGTYAITTGLNITQNGVIAGYSATHGDDAARATITTTQSAGGTILGFGATVQSIAFRNLTLTRGNSSAYTGIACPAALVGTCSVVNCVFSSLSTCIGATNFFTLICRGCAFVSSSTGVSLGTGGTSYPAAIVDNCFFSGMSTAGVGASSTWSVSVRNSVFSACAYGINLNTSSLSASFIENNSFTGSTSGCIALPTTWSPTSTVGNFTVIRNNIFYGNSGYGVSAGANLADQAVVSNNAVGSNTGGNYIHVTSTNDVTLTANPFVSSGTGNFSLNTTAGGGAGCRGAGWPGTAYPAGNSTASYPDIGACQSVGSGGSAPSNYAYSG